MNIVVVVVVVVVVAAAAAAAVVVVVVVVVSSSIAGADLREPEEAHDELRGEALAREEDRRVDPGEGV